MKGVSNSFQRKIVLSRKVAGGITAKKNHSLAPNSAILRETTCYLYISKPPNVSVWYNSIFSPRHHHVFFPVTKLQDLTFIPCRMPKILEDLPRCSGSAKGAVNSTSVLNRLSTWTETATWKCLPKSCAWFKRPYAREWAHSGKLPKSGLMIYSHLWLLKCDVFLSFAPIHSTFKSHSIT